MKIVQINAVYKNLSTGRNVYELQEFLYQKGIENYVLYGQSKGKYGQNIYYVGHRFFSKVSAFFGKTTGYLFSFSFITTLKIISKLKQMKPDLIILHNIHSNMVSIPLFLKYLSKINCGIIFVLHDCFYYTGGCVHYSKNQCYKWKKECKDCAYNKDYYHTILDQSKQMYKSKEKYISNIHNCAVIGVSKWITNESKQSAIFKNVGIFETIYNPINMELFQPKNQIDLRKRYNLKESDFILLGVSSLWSDNKGFDLIVELSKYLLEDEVIILIGKCNKKVNENKIIYIDTINEIERIADYYNISDCFLQLSQEESFGKVVAEALSCGTPVITNNKTANPELVVEGCGVVLKDVCIDALIKAKDEIKEKGKSYYISNCRKFAIEHFSLDDNMKKYLELFFKVQNLKDE